MVSIDQKKVVRRECSVQASLALNAILSLCSLARVEYRRDNQILLTMLSQSK